MRQPFGRYSGAGLALNLSGLLGGAVPPLVAAPLMAAWGTPGGGPLTTQQVDDLIAYLWSVQLKPKELRTQVDDFVKANEPAAYDKVRARQRMTSR